MLKAIPIISFLLALGLKANSQLYQEASTLPDKRPEVYAFTNATLFIDYQTVINNATLLIENGIVKETGKNVKVPKGAIISDLKGKFIYPSFIDLYTQYGIDPNKPSGRSFQYLSSQKGAYTWNEAIKSYQHAYLSFKKDEGSASEFRKSGFGVVAAFHRDGIARGTGTLVALSNKAENKSIILEKSGAYFSFDRGTSTQRYPTSLMGAIALLRQTFYDVQWYLGLKEKVEVNIPLQALIDAKSLPQIIESGDKQTLLRADKAGDEFGIQFIIKGSGDEYQQLEAITKTKAPLIIPVNFPQAIDVEDPLDADIVSLTQMKHWELAPFNLAYLSKAGITFAITTDGLKDRSKLFNSVRKSIQCGLSSKEALKALTYTPALLSHSENKIGALKPGMLANFLITSDSIFKEGNLIYENWVQGERFKLLEMNPNDIRGVYQLSINTPNKTLPETMTLSITGKIEKPDMELIKDTVKVRAELSSNKDMLFMFFDWKKNKIRLSGWQSGTSLAGIGQLESGEKIKWQATLDLKFQAPTVSDSVKKAEASSKFKADSSAKVKGNVTYPFEVYGFMVAPKSRTTLIKNATIWTNETAGILKNTDVLIENGKIVKVAKSLNSKSADTVIDGTGKHLTAGIIDEHSHIAISGGVNECSHSITSEVRIGDILDAEDINIYRNLAGGVTAVQVLHGSCNAIGGQSGIIKLRWGKTAEEMKIKGTDEFIKFALGENVKQTNFGDSYTERYPQTRMGVEQIYVDAFTRAKEYDAVWKAYNKTKKGPAPKRELQLDALAEILNKQRFITCHSYVQSEILMLMRVAEDFKIKVNTFTHILEGYKVADKMKTHGAGASTFSDWWAYKYEVKDAIPYNAAVLHKVGVVTAINSDNAEMACRLNQEAAKAIKYGNVSEEDAWKMVTLNPAKLLHIDKFTGSIKEGKDADVVLWTDNPLSIYAKVSQTYVDGICLYDAVTNKKSSLEMEKERIRLINKMLDAKKKGEPVIKPAASVSKQWHCDD